MNKRRRKKALEKSRQFLEDVLARMGGQRRRKRSPHLTTQERQIADREPTSD